MNLYEMLIIGGLAVGAFVSLKVDVAKLQTKVMDLEKKIDELISK